MLPFYHRGKQKTRKHKTESFDFNSTSTTVCCLLCFFYRVKNGSQYDLVGAALQDDLNISLQKTGFGKELGLCCERLRRLCTICFPFECRALEKRQTNKQ